LSAKCGRLRSRYLRAYHELLRNGVNLDRDSNIAAFVKLERYFDEGKAPRMIMGRDPKFNILYAQFIEPIEKAFFKLKQVANACDYHACGEKFSELVGDWFLENDMSKFEASQRYETLRLEYLVYNLVLKQCGANEGDVSLLRTLFAYKMRKKGKTQSGVDFEFYECRGSGDMDTSLGNGILNYIATQYFLISNYCPSCDFEFCNRPKCKTFKFVLKGDDSYASIPKTEKFVNTYGFFGFDAKIVIRKQPEEVEFCSGHFVEYSPGRYTYVQKLRKMLQSLTTCLNQDAIRAGWVKHYYASLGKMYKVLYAGLPVYEDIADFLIRVGGDMRLNTALITSYNLLSAFAADHRSVGQMNKSLTYVSISMVNKMDIGELNTIIRWCKTFQLDFAPELSKRCNIKNKRTVVEDIDIDLLNAQVAGVMPKKIWNYYQRLRKEESHV